MPLPDPTPFTLPRIYPITDRRLSGLSHTEQVKLLSEAGAELIQIREKERISREIFADIMDAVSAAHKRGAKVIINDRPDIAMITRADGVHLGQDDLPPDAARELMGPNAIIGYSTHDLEQAAAAALLPLSYIAFGPIFPTTTKEDPDDPVGRELLGQVRETIGSIPLVAIGGITRANAKSVIGAGADSLAVISAIAANPPCIDASFLSLLSSLDS